MLDIQHVAYYHMVSGGKYASFNAMEEEYKSCITRSVSAGANIGQGDKSEVDVKAFLTKTMALQP
jgi:hypothetical protein